MNKNWKEGFLSVLAIAMKKNSTMLIKKHFKELKVHKKTARTAIKQDLSQDLNPFDYAIWRILENKTNATSHLNIDSLKNTIVEEWNNMSEEFILKACKSFQRCIDTIIEKMVTILSKFTVFCLSSFLLFKKLKFILFYNRVVYY